MPQAAAPGQIYTEESADDSPENDDYEPPEVVSPNARQYSLPPEYRPVPVAPNMSSQMWAELKDFIGPGGGPMPDPRAGPVIDPREGMADLPPFGGGRGEPPSRYGLPQPGDAGDHGIGQRTDPGLQYHDYNPMGPEGGGGAPGPDDESVQQLIQRFFDKESGLKDQWEGKNAPTQKDIYNLWDEPTQSTVDAFNRHFGQGAAEKILRDGSTDPIPRDKDE